MTYNSKFPQRFYIGLVWLLIPILNFTKIYHRTSNIDFFWLFMFFFFWCVYLRLVLTIFFLKVLKRPILSANDTFVFDHFEGMKYYWEDIDEIVADGEILHVHLHEPQKYVNQIPYYKLIDLLKYKIFKIKPSFSIDMNLIKIKKGENKLFLEKLDECSLASVIS